MTDDPDAGEVMRIGGGRRLAAAPDALSVEVRGGGRWIRSRVVPYEDIRAVYRYELPNSRPLAALAGLWVTLLVLLLIVGANAGWPGPMLGASAATLTVVLGVLGFFRTRTAPARMLRIEAYSGVLVVPNRSPTFFQNVAARIRMSEAPPVTP